MVQPKRRKKVRTLQNTHPAQRRPSKPTETKELVLTLSVPDGEVIKVEMLDKSGQRKELSEEEFADLISEDDEEISPEEAYAVGLADVSDEDEFELDEESGADEEALERFILREIIARQLLRRGVRRFILRRLRKREIIRTRRSREEKIIHQPGSKSDKNGHEGTSDQG